MRSCSRGLPGTAMPRRSNYSFVGTPIWSGGSAGANCRTMRIRPKMPFKRRFSCWHERPVRCGDRRLRDTCFEWRGMRPSACESGLGTLPKRPGKWAWNRPNRTNVRWPSSRKSNDCRTSFACRYCSVSSRIVRTSKRRTGSAGRLARWRADWPALRIVCEFASPTGAWHSPQFWPAQAFPRRRCGQR